jgi:hypothetical protein
VGNLLSGAKPQDRIAAIRVGLFHSSDQLPGDFEISMTSVFLATSIRIDVSGKKRIGHDRTPIDFEASAGKKNITNRFFKA